jgi:hypothetical protein
MTSKRWTALKDGAPSLDDGENPLTVSLVCEDCQPALYKGREGYFDFRGDGKGDLGTHGGRKIGIGIAFPVFRVMGINGRPTAI